MTQKAVQEEYPEQADFLKQYIHDLVQRFEGEVALAWSNWTYVADPLPRDAGLWDEQYALNEENYKALKGICNSTVPGPLGPVVDPGVDLAGLGNTTILRSMPGKAGHWRLNGGAISLPELFQKIGTRFTVSELMLWYYNAPKVLRKRRHSWGSAECRAAAFERLKAYGKYGHRN